MGTNGLGVWPLTWQVVLWDFTVFCYRKDSHSLSLTSLLDVGQMACLEQWSGLIRL